MTPYKDYIVDNSNSLDSYTNLISVAVDVLENHKEGFCVILYDDNIPILKDAIKCTYWFPPYPINTILGFLMDVNETANIRIRVYKYTGLINPMFCELDHYIDDITMRIKMASEHAKRIRELM